MSKMLYNTAMDKITMSDECENRILERISESTVPTPEKKKRHIRFIPVLAAAAVFITGGIGAVAGYNGIDWLKGVFRNEEFEITDDIADMIGEAENFSCTSECGLKISPIGVIADASSVYCVLHVDSMPENTTYKDLRLSGFYTGRSENTHEGYAVGMAVGLNKDTKIAMGDYGDDNIMILTASMANGFRDGDEIFAKFASVPDSNFNEVFAPATDKYADIKFNIKFGDVKCISEEYEGYHSIHVRDAKMFMKKLLVNPTKIYIIGTDIYCDSNSKDKDLKLIMKDDSVITAYWSGMSYSGYFVYEGTTTAKHREIEWEPEKPVNPDNIKKIYLGEKCLYNSQ